MNAFVLEDEPFRRDFFVSLGIDPSRIFDHPDRFIEAVQARDASQDDTLTIFLDHDLGCYVYEPYKRELTGHDAARAMTALRVPAQYIVHSINPAGATRIALTLQSAGLRVQRVPIFDLMRQHGRNVPVLGSKP